jgi:hypothetical protein
MNLSARTSNTPPGCPLVGRNRNVRDREVAILPAATDAGPAPWRSTQTRSGRVNIWVL